MFGMALRRDAHDTAAAAEPCDDVEIPVLVKRQALRTTQPAIEHMDFAVLRDAIHAVVAGGGRPAHVEFAAGVKREMIRGDRGLQRGEHKNFTLRADLENCAAAVADKQIAFRIESYSGGDAHALDPLFAAAVGGDAINCSVMTAGNKQIAFCSQRKPGGIHQRSNEGLHSVAGVDFVEGGRHALATRSAERTINISPGVPPWIDYRMQVVGDLESEGHPEWLPFALRIHHLHRPALAV